MPSSEGSANSFGITGAYEQESLSKTTNFERLFETAFSKMEEAGQNAAAAMESALEEATKSYATRMKTYTIWQQQELAKSAKEFQQELVDQKTKELAQLKNSGASDKDQSQAATELREATEKLLQFSKDEYDAEQTKKRVQNALGQGEKQKSVINVGGQQKQEDAYQKKRQKILELEQKRSEAQKQLEEAKQKNLTKEAKKIEKEISNIDKQEKSLNKLNEVASAIGDAINNVSKLTDSSVSTAENLVNSYETNITTRLLGSGKDWESSYSLFQTQLGLSTVVSTQKALENLNTLVSNGIAYNVEQRAFLETMKESIATTFNSFDSSLLRIIKLQEQDSTVARLGMEAALNTTLNSLYGDTSYLNSLSDSVSAAILEATAQLNTTEAVDVEYVIQKWLGAMSSSGVSDSTITSLAQALGYIGSGDVSKLTGTPMQNLIVASLSNSGVNYTDLLKDGLNQSDVNTLLKSVVEYLYDIKTNTSDNLIERNAIAQVFGVSASDIQAISNVAANSDVLFGENYSYSDLTGVTSNLLSTASDRISYAKQLTNFFSNLNLETGMNIVNSDVLYSIYSLANMSENLTGGIQIPTVGVLGNYLDLNTTIERLVKSVLGGVSLISAGFSGMSKAFTGVSLSGWNATDTWTGGNIDFSNTSGKSLAGLVGSTGQDMVNDLYESAESTDEATKSKQTSEELAEDQGYTADDIFKALSDGTKEGMLTSIYSDFNTFLTDTENGFKKLVTLQDDNLPKISNIETSVCNDNGKIIKKLDALQWLIFFSKFGDKEALPVNITQVSGENVDSTTGVPITFGSEEKVTEVIKKAVSAMGLKSAENNLFNQELTLQDLIEFFVHTVGASDSGDGLKVDLANIESGISMSTLLEHEKYGSETGRTYTP